MTLRLKIVPVLFGSPGRRRMQHQAGAAREYNDPRYTGPGSAASFGDRGLCCSAATSRSRRMTAAAGLGVNAYLWRAALDTLSFMPLASADPFGGVIITDWYQPPRLPANGSRRPPTSWAGNCGPTACGWRCSARCSRTGSGWTRR